jgi:hypothetical protein
LGKVAGLVLRLRAVIGQNSLHAALRGARGTKTRCSAAVKLQQGTERIGSGQPTPMTAVAYNVVAQEKKGQRFVVLRTDSACLP